MQRDNTPWYPIENAQLDWSASGTPRSVPFDDVYYSEFGGIEESQYVFLQGNNLPERWKTNQGEAFCILETGFGSGLNFLLTWQAWRQLATPRPRLHYVSIEKHPLSATDMARAVTRWPQLAQYAQALLAYYPQPIAGTHRLVFEDGALTLDLWWEDIAAALPDIASCRGKSVDAWYLDGFTPARNPQMWEQELYGAMSELSRPAATFATFTAASDVRRGLVGAGFKVERASGFGSKRECLRGQISGIDRAPKLTVSPWDLPEQKNPMPASALIVGAGLAGCTIASALARRGIKVTVLEQNQIASAGSGNDQGILYTRMSTRHSALSDFALQSFCFAYHYYHQLFASGMLLEGRDGALCGSFHQSSRTSEMAQLAPVLASVPGLAQVLDAQAASAKLGISQTQSGYWFERSGWLRPESVCRALLAHRNITVQENTGPVEIRPHDTAWCARAGGETTIQTDCAIIATGTSANSSSDLSWLPLQAIRGQTTHLPISAAMRQLQAGFCHSGYICPDNGDYHCIGATFDPDDPDGEIRSQDHRRNLNALARAVPDWQKILSETDIESLTGRVSYRCATPDYLPVVGAVPHYQPFVDTYAPLRKNAKQLVGQCGKYLPGLYLSAGHGSRGLTSAPLAAEALASQICGEVQPLSRELQRAIAPARFIIRQLSRGRI